MKQNYSQWSSSPQFLTQNSPQQNVSLFSFDFQDFSLNFQFMFMQPHEETKKDLFQEKLSQADKFSKVSIQQEANSTQIFLDSMLGNEYMCGIPEDSQNSLLKQNVGSLNQTNTLIIDQQNQSINQPQQTSNSVSLFSIMTPQQIQQDHLNSVSIQKPKRKYNPDKNNGNQCKKHLKNVLQAIMLEEYGENVFFEHLIKTDEILNKIFYQQKKGIIKQKKSGSKEEIKLLLSHQKLKFYWKAIIQDGKIDMEIMESKYKDPKYKIKLIKLCKKYMAQHYRQ